MRTDLRTVANTGGSISGPLAIYPDANAAIVRFGYHQVRIEAGRVVVDGKERGRIPAGTKGAEVSVRNLDLTLKADGTTVLTEELGK